MSKMQSNKDVKELRFSVEDMTFVRDTLRK